MSLPKKEQKVQIIFGAAGVARLAELGKAYEILRVHGVTTLDTAHLYAQSEETLGSTSGSQRFDIDTKAPGFSPGSATAQKIKDAMAKSLKDLDLPQVDVYYLHAPDKATPLEETLGAINDLYQEGKFKRFGICNYDATDIQRIHDIATDKGWVKPTVYQGNFNPVARHLETRLFPLLRKLGMSFNAYSPLAGGFLVRSKDQLSGENLANASGRWDPKTFSGKLYFGMYGKPALLEALEKWEQIAKEASVSKAALAYRWVAYHSELKGELGDGMIIGASSVKQLTETLMALEEGPLPEKAAMEVNNVWNTKGLQEEAPVNNYIGASKASLL